MKEGDNLILKLAERKSKLACGRMIMLGTVLYELDVFDWQDWLRANRN